MSLQTGAADAGMAISNFINPLFGSEKVTTSSSGTTPTSSTKSTTVIVAVVVVLVIGAVSFLLLNKQS
jgi:hypothetical protein